MSKIVICADDLGLTVGINRGIEEAFNRGVLTSASLMANTPAFDDACERILKNKQWSIGIHLNCLRGQPVLAPAQIPALIDGQFFKHSFLSLGFASFNKAVQNQIEKEYRAQIEKALSRGVVLDHIDSEKHHHMWPAIFSIARRLAKDYKIPFVRVTKEVAGVPSLESKRPKVSQVAKGRFLGMLGRCQREGLPFWGLEFTGEMTAELYEHFFRHFKGSVAEVMCHPGYETAEDREALKTVGPFRLQKSHREKELAALLDARVKNAAQTNGVELVSFKDLKNGNA